MLNKVCILWWKEFEFWISMVDQFKQGAYDGLDMQIVKTNEEIMTKFCFPNFLQRNCVKSVP
jgi:hypothetical protein